MANFKNKSSGDVVVAWAWDGHDEISLQQMLLEMPYTVDHGSVWIAVGEDGERIEIKPGTYILNGPQVGEFRTMAPDVFEAEWEPSA